mmetsp:Transcript_23816/g.58297  ORF Transcript_23816/g.58297 Transcript_23816/m.58297 type:complete len:97 (-) Transcript_23816:744-1034(-)
MGSGLICISDQVATVVLILLILLESVSHIPVIQELRCSWIAPGHNPEARSRDSGSTGFRLVSSMYLVASSEGNSSRFQSTGSSLQVLPLQMKKLSC